MSSEVDVHFTIRDVQPGDVAVLAQLLCELGYETTESEMEMRIERIATDERYRTFVAVRDGNVCGMIGTFAYYNFVHNDPCGRIVALVVRKDSRRLGVGRRLVAAVEKRLCPARHQARRTGYKAYPERCLKVLRVAWLRAKRVAICEATSGERLMGLNVPKLERSCDDSRCSRRNSRSAGSRYFK